MTEEILSSETPIEDLRAKAFAAATTNQEGTDGQRTYRTRSVDVKRYVLARAGGRCDCCNGTAPFQTPEGMPYLESHHTNMISEGGPDDPRWVAAVCPNCHREIHYGASCNGLNHNLRLKIREIEDNL